MFGIAICATAVASYFVYKHVRAERDIPELMRILWSANDMQMRCIGTRKRGADRLFLDSHIDTNNVKNRLFNAAKLAKRQGLVDMQYHAAMIGGDYFVSIRPEFLGD